MNILLTPGRIGSVEMRNRIVMPPMSRLRAQWPTGIPSDLMREYYSQRASDGGLILTEATAISPSGRGYRGAPCLYRDEQVTGWKRITDAVHANGGYMFVQLWHAGELPHCVFGCRLIDHEGSAGKDPVEMSQQDSIRDAVTETQIIRIDDEALVHCLDPV